MCHISVVKGDYIFAEWDEDGQAQFNKKVHELRKQGYRKIDQEHGWLNYHEFYKKKGKRKVITVTLMCM